MGSGKSRLPGPPMVETRLKPSIGEKMAAMMGQI
jgi:glycosyltransferase A (GT-A) superfamily protein (DUF2064 family)